MDRVCPKCGDISSLNLCYQVVHYPEFKCLRDNSFYIELPENFLSKTYIPCMARREVLQKLNVRIDEETIAVADLIMLTKGRVFRVVVTNEADQTYFGCPRWRELAEAYRFEAGNRVYMGLNKPDQEIMVDYYVPDSP